MQSIHPSRLAGIAVKIVAIAATAVAVYALHTPSVHASDLRDARAVTMTVTPEGPTIDGVYASEVWSADEAANGMRPDAAH